MPEASHSQGAHGAPASGVIPSQAGGVGAFTSFAAIWQVLAAHRRFVLVVIGGLLLLCLLYCLFAPKQYEAKARVALRTEQGAELNIRGDASSASSSSATMELAEIETMANVFRSDQLAWRVILDHKLYREAAFNGSFARRFPDFKPQSPGPDAQEYLLKRFHRLLHVSTVPRTLLVEIRFRSKNAALSAAVVNELIEDFREQESQRRVNETRSASEWLKGQLALLKAQTEEKERQMEEFKRTHGVLITPGARNSGQGQAMPELVEVDEISRELAAASGERILREARYKAAMEGEPELALDSDSPMLAEEGAMETAVFKQIETQRSSLQQEFAQLSLEHGPNYWRVAEIRKQLEDLDRQRAAERGKLREMLRRGLQAAQDRENLMRAKLAEKLSEGQKVTDAAMRYEAMASEVAAGQEMYLRIEGRLREAGLDAGIHPSDMWVVDPPIVPAKPVAPDPPLDMAITLFVAFWLAMGGAWMMESIHPKALQAAVMLLMVSLAGAVTHGQAPIPNTQGLPTGVTKVVAPPETKSAPDPQTSPQVWNGRSVAGGGLPGIGSVAAIVPAALAPGDVLDVSEFHAPEFHSIVRVSEAGTVTLPMIGEVKVGGLSDAGASQAIAKELVEKGILLHPQVFVLVTASAGQDVSVLGEVTHPGVYPYTVHHRMLDLIAAASGLSPAAGGVVGIFHRDDPQTPHIVALRGNGKGADEERNPELQPGDTIQVTRAGLVYVVGGVMRPGGFAMDPQQRLTVLQALSLAWGPSQSAATRKAVLIREQKSGGRLVTAINLKRMLRGKDPDLPLHERDILFVPDSLAKSIWSRSVESAIQSAAGVSLYAGMVYSQRF